MKYTATIVEKKTSAKTGKDYFVMTLTDEAGAVHEKVSTFDPVEQGAELNGEIIQNGDFKNFKKAQAVARSNFASGQKERVIEAAQQRKEKSIHLAQDRSAWMWARTSAANIVANHTAYKFYSEEKILDLVEDIATKIYNMEPTEPFTT